MHLNRCSPAAPCTDQRSGFTYADSVNDDAPDDPTDQQAAQAVQVARLYYHQGLTTGDIARELGLSRPKVSRLLALARRNGTVDIRIHDPQGHPCSLQARLMERWPGVQAQVVGLPPHSTQDLRLERVALAAAHWLGSALRPGLVVGLAWGNTLDAVSRALTPRPLSGVQFVQLNGSASVLELSSGFVGGTLTRLAQAVRGQAHLFPVPTFFDDPATKQAMWRERSVQHVVQLQRQAELLLFSVGSPHAALPSHVYAAGYLDPDDLTQLEREGGRGRHRHHVFPRRRELGRPVAQRTFQRSRPRADSRPPEHRLHRGRPRQGGGAAGGAGRRVAANPDRGRNDGGGRPRRGLRTRGSRPNPQLAFTPLSGPAPAGAADSGQFTTGGTP